MVSLYELDLLTSKSEQFIFVANCVQVVNLVKFQGCICQIFTGGSEFRLAMTDRATIAGTEVANLAKLVSGV